MKIALAQLNYHIGNFERNNTLMIDALRLAKKQGAELVVFAELSVCGYPPRDFLGYEYFVDHCMESVEAIAKECFGIAAIVGVPTANKASRGKALFNSALLIEEGKIKSIRNKTLLPTYDVFDENRYFEKGTDLKLIDFKGWKIALTICEDLWNVTDKPLYDSFEMDELAQQQPDFIINIAASPFSNVHADKRKSVLVKNALRYHVPLFFVNQVGSQTELIFDGGSMVVNSEGSILEELKYFEEEIKLFEINKIKNSVVVNSINPSSATKLQEKQISVVHDALVMGIRDYFRKQNFKKAIIGSSGGIDSAVTLVLAVRALGKDNVRSVLMPSEFSTSHSLDDAKHLASILGVQADVIPIGNIYDSFNTALSPFFKGMAFDVAEENIQARTRAVLLMALANKFGYILLNTSNKSELAVGYSTLYGDMCGGLSVLGDLYKTEVYKLANFINENEIIIPENILLKSPSAELRPGQKDSDSLPEYHILDKILFQYIEKNNIETTGDKAVVKKVLGLVNASEYKRHQAAPILRVSEKSFGMGRRMPIVAKYSV